MDMQMLAKAYQQIRSGGNPASIFQQVAGSNPQAAQYMQAINGGSSITDVVNSALQNSGMTREQAIEQLKQFGLV